MDTKYSCVFNSLKRPYVTSGLPVIDYIISKIYICTDAQGIWIAVSLPEFFRLSRLQLTRSRTLLPYRSFVLAVGILSVLYLPLKASLYFSLLLWLWSPKHYLLRKNHFPASTTMSIQPHTPALLPRRHKAFHTEVSNFQLIPIIDSRTPSR